MNTAEQLTSYDEVPYPSVPFAQTHPNRLATLATLFGLSPASPDTCRVLELGCAGADNLIPLALAHPRSQFYGIDLSQRHMDSAREALQRFGVSNVHVRRMNILDFPDDVEPFDYIIAHGVYSWVPDAVRDKLLAICRRHLKPQGVAFVSYNALPGWRMRGVVRELLMYHVRDIPEPQARIEHAGAMLKFLARSIPPEIKLYATLFERVVSSFEDDHSTSARLYHDFLEPDNEPIYFHQFMDRASRHDLQYLAEADISEMNTLRFPAEVAETLAKLGDDIVQREQYLDFLKNRMFRQTLLCRKEVPIDRETRPERLAGMHVMADIACEEPGADLRRKEPVKFRAGDGVEAAVDHPVTKAALWHLGQIAPQSISFDELQVAARARLVSGSLVVQPRDEFAQDTRQLAENLLRLYHAGVIELHAGPPRFTTDVSERPMASPWARYQIEHGRPVTNLRHHGVKMSPLNARLVWLMDGTRDRSQLLDDLLRYVIDQQLSVVKDGRPAQGEAETRRFLNDAMDGSLRMVAKLALLVA